MSPSVLEARRVSRRYPGGIQALRNVDLAVSAGETLVLVGESGCGKTTLLKMFNRMVEPSSGKILVGGRSASSLDPIALRRQTGYVQQDGGLLPHWTVARNVGLVPWLLGWEADRRRERTEELLELVGLPLARYGKRYPRELSGGQRQRVAFARALAAEPGVVLLDEPFGALDALTRLELQREFLQLKSRVSATMLLVTHDLEEAFRLGDRIAVMKEGGILQTGSPKLLRRQPADGYVSDLLRLLQGGPE
jgi:osmoprotectant transport system ATP-binding protein